MKNLILICLIVSLGFSNSMRHTYVALYDKEDILPSNKGQAISIIRTNRGCLLMQNETLKIISYGTMSKVVGYKNGCKGYIPKEYILD